MADKPLITDVIQLDGKLNTADDPISIGKNFRTLKNLRYAGDHVQGIGGMTKINSSALSTWLKPRAGHHFQKQQPVESHILVQAFNSGLTEAPVWDNETVPPSTGSFTSPTIMGAATGETDRGRFSDAPLGSVAFCNGDHARLWAGRETQLGRFFAYNTSNVRIDETERILNTLTDSLNLVTLVNLSPGIDSSTKLMLHMDGADASTTFTDSSSGAKTVTANGNAQIDTTSYAMGDSSGLFDGTGDYLSTPDHADFDLSGGVWTIDFWINDNGATGEVYCHATDANNYMAVRVDSFAVQLKIVAAGVTVVSLTTEGSGIGAASLYMNGYPDTNGFTHVEVSENGDSYYIFINGKLIVKTTDTDRPANYTGTVQIGGSTVTGNYFSGWLDELRVSNGAIRHTADFEPEFVPYGTGGNSYMLIGSVQPLEKIKFYVGTANTNTSTMKIHVNYTISNKTLWLERPVTSDGTSASSKTLAQTGTVTFGVLDSQYTGIRVIDGVSLHWTKVSISGGVSSGTTLSHVTVSYPVQDIKDIWDGENRKVLSFQKYTSGVYQDLTVNVFDDTYDSTNTATYAQVGSLAVWPDSLFIGFPEPMNGLTFRFVGGSTNTTANSILSVAYWNGTEWIQFSSNNMWVEDGTSEPGNIGFAKSGTISWSQLSNEKKYVLSRDVPLYFYRVFFSAALSADVKLFYVGGIPQPKKILGYKAPLFADNRLYLLGEKSKDKNKAICSANATVNVFNGNDFGEFFFGDERELTAGAWVYNRVGADLRSLKLFFKANETWVLEGTGPETWRVYQLSNKIGCIAPQTVSVVSLGGESTLQVAIWQGAKGVYISDGQSIMPIHWDIRNLFDERASDKINVTYSKESAGFVDQEKMEYHWLVATGAATTMNREFVYDLLKKKWYEIARGTGKELQIGIPVKDADGNNYIYGAIETGYLERLENGTDFDGTAIAHEFQTGDIAFAGIMEETTIRNVKLLQAAKSTTTNEATITHYADTKTTGTALATYDPTASGKRVADVVKGTNQKGVFHSFKGTMSTSDETIGWEPIALGLFFKDVRKDTN